MLLRSRWFPVVLFVAIAAVAWVVVGISVQTWWNDPAHLSAHAVEFAHRPFLEGWTRWDATWYLQIARDGYSYRGPHTQSSVAFFPAYPLSSRAVGWITGDTPRAAILVTIVCGLAVAVMFFRWCEPRIGTRSARFALVALLTYPFAFYLFGAIYADALFIAATLAAFLLVERDLPVLAGLAGAVATAARPVGAAVVIGLVVRVLEREGVLVGSPFSRATPLASIPAPSDGGALVTVTPPATRIAWLPRRLDLGRLRGRDAGVLLSAGGLVAYAAYLGSRFGEPLAFEQVSGAKGWEQTPGIHTWFKLALGSRLLHPPYDRLDVALFAQAAVTIAALVLVPLVVRRFGWGYAAYVVTVLLIPAISTKDFGGMGRYVLAAFPCTAVVGVWLAAGRVTRAVVYLGASSVLLLVCLVLYSHWVYLS
jgi:hypothetical protein